MRRFSLGRYGLPVVAALLLAVAVWVILRDRPDRSMTTPADAPPTAPASQARGGTVSGAGVVEPAGELVQVTALVPGVVTRVFVAAGERVSRGQPLFALDDRDARARLAEADAGLAYARDALRAARVDLENARAQAALLARVQDPRAVSEQQRLDRRAAVAQAEARLALAKADLERAEAAAGSARTEIDRRLIRAPIAAQVLQVRTRAGQFVTSGPPPGGSSDPAVTLGDTDPLHVRIDIDETEIPRVRQGAAAIISPRGDARRRVQAAFVRLEPLVIPKRSLTNAATERVDVRVLQVIYALPGDARGFFVGQQVDAFIPADAPPARLAAQPAGAAAAP